MRKALLRAAAWLTTFGFIAGLVAALITFICCVGAAYFGWAGNVNAFLAWGTVAAGAFVAATALFVAATILCVALKFSSEIEPIY